MAMMRWAVLLAMVLPVCLQHSVQRVDAGASLFGQTAQGVLDRRFPSPAISYLVLDAQSGAMLARRWSDEERPIPVGSLVKPFTAFMYAQNHRRFPTVICHGRKDGCWLPRGHGRITLTRAIAESCNAYFLALARGIPAGEANRMLGKLGLPAVNTENKARALSGLDDGWRVTPVVFARAYLKLVRGIRNGPGEREGILLGMRESAQRGTAREVKSSVPVLAKTGTAACVHNPRSTADGLTVVLYPADDPRVLLLVRVHGATGAATAGIAGEMLKALE